MKELGYIGHIRVTLNDSPENSTRQLIERRLRNIVDLAISVGRCEGLFKSLPHLHENKLRQESDGHSR